MQPPMGQVWVGLDAGPRTTFGVQGFGELSRGQRRCTQNALPYTLGSVPRGGQRAETYNRWVGSPAAGSSMRPSGCVKTFTGQFTFYPTFPMSIWGTVFAAVVHELLHTRRSWLSYVSPVQRRSGGSRGAKSQLSHLQVVDTVDGGVGVWGAELEEGGRWGWR